MANLADKYIERALTLFRAAEGEAIAASQILHDVHKEISKLILAQNFNTMTKAGLGKLQKEISKQLEVFYKTEWPNELKEISAIAIEKEVSWNVGILLGEQALRVRKPVNKTIQKRAAGKLYQGRKFETWVKREFGGSARKINKILKTGFIKGRTPVEVERDVFKVANRARHDTRTITRSFFMHNATEAKETVFGLNPDIVEGAIWISTLDNRTTPRLCGPRDFLLYDNERNPVDHELPWLDGPGRLHWNCRSTSMPKLIGVPLSGHRSSSDAGADYESGDDTTRTGRVRKNSKNARDKGIYKTSQHTTKMNYEGWLKGQSKKNIDFVSDILGKKNARDFRDGVISLKELGLENPVARPTNRTLI